MLNNRSTCSITNSYRRDICNRYRAVPTNLKKNKNNFIIYPKSCKIIFLEYFLGIQIINKNIYQDICNRNKYETIWFQLKWKIRRFGSEKQLKVSYSSTSDNYLNDFHLEFCTTYLRDEADTLWPYRSEQIRKYCHAS